MTAERCHFPFALWLCSLVLWCPRRSAACSLEEQSLEERARRLGEGRRLRRCRLAPAGAGAGEQPHCGAEEEAGEGAADRRLERGSVACCLRVGGLSAALF